MRKLSFASLAVATLIAVPAMAADMAVKARPIAVDPSYNWTGFYIGVNAGGFFDDASSLTPSGLFPANYGASALLVSGGNQSGFTGGGQIGYNWQADHAVFGLEADFNFIDRSNGTLTVTGLPPTPFGFGAAPNVFHSTLGRSDFFGTVRGRIGYSWNRTLLYLTGGLAYTDGGHPSATFTNVGGVQYANFTTSSRSVGYTVGAGLEYAWTNNWSVKAEYLFVDFGGSRTLADPVTPGGAGYTFTASSDHFSVARVGLNYKWGSPVVARY
jgi:outer membrane immunogenic protein